MNESGVRKHRIAGAIRRHLSAELAQGVADPRLFSLAISDVQLTADLSLAKIKVRLMFGGDEPEARLQAMSALGRITPGLRASVSSALRMRRVPELRFFYDESVDINAEIEGVLRDIERESTEKKRALDEQGGPRSLDSDEPSD